MFQAGQCCDCAQMLSFDSKSKGTHHSHEREPPHHTSTPLPHTHTTHIQPHSDVHSDTNNTHGHMEAHLCTHTHKLTHRHTCTRRRKPDVMCLMRCVHNWRDVFMSCRWCLGHYYFLPTCAFKVDWLDRMSRLRQKRRSIPMIR